MFVVTTSDVPGYRITGVYGEVMGVMVCSPNVGLQMNFGGGERHEYTQSLYASRVEVIRRMWNEAQHRGANAVVSMRMTSSQIGESTFTEFCAYGTAVFIEPENEHT